MKHLNRDLKNLMERLAPVLLVALASLAVAGSAYGGGAGVDLSTAMQNPLFNLPNQPTAPGNQVGCPLGWTCGGRIAACIGTHGISENTLRKHFRRELETSKAEIDAFATSQLLGLMRDKNLGALCFYLKCRGGWQETSAHRLVNEQGKDRSLLDEFDRLVEAAEKDDGPE